MGGRRREEGMEEEEFLCTARPWRDDFEIDRE
jgi:hypothetical protein